MVLPSHHLGSLPASHVNCQFPQKAHSYQRRLKSRFAGTRRFSTNCRRIRHEFSDNSICRDLTKIESIRARARVALRGVKQALRAPKGRRATLRSPINLSFTKRTAPSKVAFTMRGECGVVNEGFAQKRGL
jgi:hypothetical protein